METTVEFLVGAAIGGAMVWAGYKCSCRPDDRSRPYDAEGNEL